MNLEFLNVIYGWFKKQSPEVIRFICIVLILWIFGHYTASGVKSVISNSKTIEKEDKRHREQYVVEITPHVNRLIQNILNVDSNAGNVVLLNYHNTLLSSNGLSYRYLTAICEQFQGRDAKPCIHEWKELDYLNYGEEIQKINAQKYMMLEDNDEGLRNFPKFVWVMHNSGIKTACFYPILGTKGPVGMLVIGYRNTATQIDVDYVRRVIYPTIQPLASLLDYDNSIVKIWRNEN